MTPDQFIDKWSRADRTERQAAQEHFIDLCHMLGEPTPNEGDAEAYSFEKGVSKTDGSGGFADVWKRGHFGWEYKKDRANLDRAYQQLQLYSVALENPPLLVVSDTKRFRIYTNWTNTVQKTHEFTLEDLTHTETRDLLRNVFRNPEKLRPDKTREQVTNEAAKEFSTIAERMRMAGHAPEKVAHFLNRIVFCLFAEDVNLLPDDLFKRLLDTLAKRRGTVKEGSQKMLAELFANMRVGGAFGLEHILHFNGGLFDDDEALPLDADSLDILREIAKQDWSAIDPSIFGTLFERFLDPDKRAQIGAHYTDAGKIMMIVEPVIMRPLNAEWASVKMELADILAKGRTRDGRPGPAAKSKAEARLDVFLKRLADIRVLDPACGSGNFLYMALQSLKDLERRIIVEVVEMGLQLRVLHCGPENVKGIEINHYAAELARTTIWIGDIQWRRRNGFEAKDEPVLRPLDAIECRDALVTQNMDGSHEESTWPDAEFIVGNPPFLGGKLMRRALGDNYLGSLFRVFSEAVPAEADLVTYWFEKARKALLANRKARVGFVATNSIRSGASRAVLKSVTAENPIFEAWSDQEWIVDGAAVRVSIVCFSSTQMNEQVRLDGKPTGVINSDLTDSVFDLTQARRLLENRDRAFQGITKGAPFEVEYKVAREWLVQPTNPNGQPNSKVLRRIWSGGDIAKRREVGWAIDFTGLTEKQASLYEAPFSHVVEVVKPIRLANRRALYRANWWLFAEGRPGFRYQIEKLDRYIATPKVSRHRVFVWFDKTDLPDNLVIAITRSDYTTFGILHSRMHEQWALARGAWIGVGNDPTYTPTTTFETFPFPAGLTPDLPAEHYADDERAQLIAAAAKNLDDLRNKWLNPPELIKIMPEVVPGYPDRVLPRDEATAAELKKRTLTNLYNHRPQWLADAHRDLDAVVAAAYGWPADISKEDVLAKLLGLNLERAAAGSADLLAGEKEDE